MDLRALEYTRQHYDAHSNQFASTQDALRARAQGPGAPLKKFHNDIKRQLISRCARRVGPPAGGRWRAARGVPWPPSFSSIPGSFWQVESVMIC